MLDIGAVDQTELAVDDHLLAPVRPLPITASPPWVRLTTTLARVRRRRP